MIYNLRIEVTSDIFKIKMNVTIDAEDHPQHGWMANQITIDDRVFCKNFKSKEGCVLLVEFVASLRYLLKPYVPNLATCYVTCNVKRDDDMGLMKQLLQDEDAYLAMRKRFGFS